MAGKEKQIKKKMETTGTVKHFLADGRMVDSIEGYVVPCTGPTAVVYSILYDFAKRKANQPEEIKKNQAPA